MPAVRDKKKFPFFVLLFPFLHRSEWSTEISGALWSDCSLCATYAFCFLISVSPCEETKSAARCASRGPTRKSLRARGRNFMVLIIVGRRRYQSRAIPKYLQPNPRSIIKSCSSRGSLQILGRLGAARCMPDNESATSTAACNWSCGAGRGFISTEKRLKWRVWCCRSRQLGVSAVSYIFAASCSDWRCKMSLLSAILSRRSSAPWIAC